MTDEQRKKIINEINDLFDDTALTIPWSELSDEEPPIIQNGGEDFTYVLNMVDFEGVWGLRKGIDPGYICFEEIQEDIQDNVLEKVYKAVKNYFNA